MNPRWLQYLDDLSNMAQLDWVIESKNGLTDVTLKVTHRDHITVVQSIGAVCLSEALEEIANTLMTGRKPTRK